MSIWIARAIPWMLIAVVIAPVAAACRQEGFAVFSPWFAIGAGFSVWCITYGLSRLPAYAERFTGRDQAYYSFIAFAAGISARDVRPFQRYDLFGPRHEIVHQLYRGVGSLTGLRFSSGAAVDRSAEDLDQVSRHPASGGIADPDEQSLRVARSFFRTRAMLWLVSRVAQFGIAGLVGIAIAGNGHDTDTLPFILGSTTPLASELGLAWFRWRRLCVAKSGDGELALMPVFDRATLVKVDPASRALSRARRALPTDSIGVVDFSDVSQVEIRCGNRSFLAVGESADFALSMMARPPAAGPYRSEE